MRHTKIRSIRFVLFVSVVALLLGLGLWAQSPQAGRVEAHKNLPSTPNRVDYAQLRAPSSTSVPSVGDLFLANTAPGFTVLPGPQPQQGRVPVTSNSGANTGQPQVKSELKAPDSPLVVLYDQINNPAPVPGGVTSQDFEAAQNAFDNQAADDFVVPAGQTWNVNQVEVAGEYSASGPAASVNITFYANTGGNLPGAAVAGCTYTGLAYSGGASFNVTLPSACVLTAGTYWVSVQARQDFAPAGQWFWDNRLVQSNSGAAWQNPGGGFAVGCTTWGRKTTCLATQNGPDELFRLSGTIGAGVSTCPPTTINGSITAGDLTQTIRLFRDGIPDSCAGAGTCSTTGAGTFAYDAYTFQNNTAATHCVTVEPNTACTGTNFIFVAAYLGSFNPASICTNWIADSGFSPNPTQPFAFNVAAGQTFVVVVSEVTSGAGCPAYSFTINGCGPTAAAARVSGRITTPDGSPLGGAVMHLSGPATRTTVTDGAGNYHFDDLAIDSFYTVTPSLANHHFAPANRSFSLVGNMTDVGFTANADASQTANAIDTTEYFVRQQYLDFLGREPDQGGLEYWSDQINQCGGEAACISRKRLDVSAAFFMSAEFQQTGSYIYGVYAGTLGRTLNYGEFNADRSQVLGGSGLDPAKTAFAQAFVQRPEFTSRYPQGMTREQFVDAVIQTMTQRSGVDQSALRNQLLGDYDVGGRARVVRHASEAGSFVAAEYNKAFVLMEYFGYMRREIDQGGYYYWLDVLNNGAAGNYRGMVCAFLTSTEYQLRFSSVVTRSNAECGP